MEVCSWAPTCHPRQCVTVSEGDDALRLCETKGVGVVAVFAEVVTSTAVVTVPPGRTVPDRVFGLELMTEAATVGEWSGSG